MIISIIVAASENNAIGKDGDIPWHLRADLKNFKQVTMGHHLIVGRKTYQTIGKPLPGRTMVVISRNQEFTAEGCTVVHSVEDALKKAEEAGDDEVFVAGGAEIFSQALPIASKLYYTRVHTEVEADTFFPAINCESWRALKARDYKADDDNDFDFTISVFEKQALDQSS